ncbi:MAG: DUF4276 family protein [Polyangiaceae bacterium]|nr:DUF4276 family protein [Polyangiaceae bacterium]
MRVLVYVEGTSDRAALEALLEPVLQQAHGRRVAVNFLPLRSKDRVLEEAPKKAALDLLERPQDWHFAVPDLHPMGRFRHGPLRHDCGEALCELMRRQFAEHAQAVHLETALHDRFRAHCLRHDLEALLLACPGALQKRLATKEALSKSYNQTVEEQDDDRPPKRVVEELFRKHLKRRYVETDDAPWILRHGDLATVEAACPLGFGAFVRDLRRCIGL